MLIKAPTVVLGRGVLNVSICVQFPNLCVMVFIVLTLFRHIFNPICLFSLRLQRLFYAPADLKTKSIPYMHRIRNVLIESKAVFGNHVLSSIFNITVCILIAFFWTILIFLDYCLIRDNASSVSLFFLCY